MATLRDYIEEAADQAGSLTMLASILGATQPRLSRMKSGKEHMPMMMAVKLADALDIDRFTVIVAAEIATASNDDEYNYWTDILQNLGSEEIANTPKLSYIRQMMI